MNNIKNYIFSNKINNLFFCLFPITFVLGNTAVNINTILLIFFSCFYFYKNIFKQNFSVLDKLILLFFSYTIITMIINFFERKYFSTIEITHFEQNVDFFLFYKTIFFLRFFFLYFVIKYLIFKNIINFKNFFLVSSFVCLFVCIDIFIQFFFNKDIFGFEPIHSRKISGPFAEELIAGSYIQKFFLFILFSIGLAPKLKRKKIIIFFSIILIIGAALLSGNRMPFILVIISIFLISIFVKETRKYFLAGSIIFILFFSIAYKNNIEIKNNYFSFYKQILKIIKVPFASKINRSDMPLYFDEFESFYDTWRLNEYFGGGIRSFRIFCPYRKNIDIDERATCNSHPHNYYLEILTDLGIFGLIILIIIFSKIIKDCFKNILKNKNNKNKKYIFLVFFILFFVEVFPVKNTGSFFSTWNITFIFILISCLSALNSNKHNH